jgi:hypothetical protein
MIIQGAVPKHKRTEFAADPFYLMGIPLDRPLEIAGQFYSPLLFI